MPETKIIPRSGLSLTQESTSWKWTTQLECKDILSDASQTLVKSDLNDKIHCFLVIFWKLIIRVLFKIHAEIFQFTVSRIITHCDN